MRTGVLLARSLRYFWRSNVAVVLGVAAAAAVLGGSLVVGDSVRGSLARSALARLGRATHAVESSGFFRTGLSDDVARHLGSGSETAPLLALRGVATHATSQRRAGDVQVYGVDDRFWSLQGLSAPELGRRDALVSAPLAREIGAAAGDSVLVRIHGGDDVPGSTLFGRRDDPARGLRLTVSGVRSRDEMGELSLRPRAAGVKAVFVPLATLQSTLGQPERANVVLVAAPPGLPAEGLTTALGAAATLEDLGVRLRVLEARRALQLETTTALVDDRTAEAAVSAAREQGLGVRQSLVYLANTMAVGSRAVPYSLVAAVDDATFASLAGGPPPRTELPPIVLNDWAAEDLQASAGDRVRLEYYLWREEGRLETDETELRLAATTPLLGLADDRDLVPEYPGITESVHLSDWDPPFPVDLDRIRPKDEEYWDRHRTTPKAFVPLAVGQELWGHRLGRITSLRLAVPEGTSPSDAHARYAGALRETLLDGGEGQGSRRLAVVPLRAAALEASRGSTDFGEYFVYFSFFLVVAGLLLAGLFFRLGLEQRLREVGLLEALGFPAARLRRLYLSEGAVLAALGAVLGMAGAAAYAALVLWALRALWTADLGTGELSLHLGLGSPIVGALGAAVAAMLAIGWTLRDLRRLSPRTLLAGALNPWSAARRRGLAVLPWALVAAALVLLAASAVGAVPAAGGFFGAGGLLLVAALLLVRRLVGARSPEALGLRTVSGLGLRGVSFRPGRSVLCVALIAFATFVVVSVGAFRREGVHAPEDPRGESGGYRLMAWSLVPLDHDPTTDAGRAALGLDDVDLGGVEAARFRARRGDDASCLNLFEPQDPTVLAPSADFVRAGRFAFASSLASSDEERANPWLLLERPPEASGAIPVVADASSLQYILHHELGDVTTLGATGVKVRFVGALVPGLFQGEILMGERSFLEAFPDHGGHSFFLFDVPAARASELSRTLEERLSDYGLDVTATADRLRDLHAVENTYIATFQALGALGLLLGTLGVATVLMRNALEQRGELALLRAVGYQPRHVTRMVLVENAALLGLGFLAGAVPALVAIAPVFLERHGTPPVALLGALLAALAATGALVSGAAVSFIRRMPLVESLRSE